MSVLKKTDSWYKIVGDKKDHENFAPKEYSMDSATDAILYKFGRGAQWQSACRLSVQQQQ